MDIEGTVFITSTTTTTTIITITGPKGDHHVPHEHEQQTFTCDWTVREQREARACGPKHRVLGSLKVNQHQRIETVKASQSFRGGLCVQRLLLQMRAGSDVNVPKHEQQMEGSRHGFQTDS